MLQVTKSSMTTGATSKQRLLANGGSGGAAAVAAQASASNTATRLAALKSSLTAANGTNGTNGSGPTPRHSRPSAGPFSTGSASEHGDPTRRRDTQVSDGFPLGASASEAGGNASDSGDVGELIGAFAEGAQAFLESLASAFDARDAAAAAVRAKAESLDAELGEQMQMTAEAREEVARAAAETARVTDELDRARADAAAATARVEELAADRERAESAHAAEMAAVQERVDEIMSELASAAAALEAQERQSEELTTELGTVHDALRDSRAELDGWDVMGVEWAKEKDRLEDDKAQLAKDLQQFRAQIEILQEESANRADLVVELETAVEEGRRELEMALGQVADLEEKLKGLQKTHDSAAATLASTSKDLAAKSAALDAAHAAQTALEAQLVDRAAYIANADHEMQILREQRESFETELVRITDALEDLGVEKSKVEEALKAATAASRSHEESVEVMANQLDEEKAARAAAEDELRAERARTKARNDATGGGGSAAMSAAGTAEKDREIAALRAEIDDLKKRNAPLLVPKTRGPSSIMSTSSQLYSTMERLGLKRKADGSAASVVGGSGGISVPKFRVPAVASSNTAGSEFAGPAFKRARVDASAAGNGHVQFRTPGSRRGAADSAVASEYAGSVVGMATSRTPGSRASSGGMRKSTTVTFSGFRESLPDYTPGLKEKLVKMIETLNGAVVTANDEFDMTITHVVTPANSRTFKTLAAALSHRWLIFDVAWIQKSLEAGKFVPPEAYGVRYFSAPFKGKSVCLTPKFLEENASRQFRIDNAKQLVETYGKGTLTTSPKGADWILTAASDKEAYTGKRLDWTGFIKLIMPDEQLKAAK
ncbi:hypothetical protein BC828DRAFT_380989 [Blastocladiella britannica]|nr:hypothetical protein BC828DRAFT_380989 [Blastocladiella britannica]